jgi:ferrochelatase
MNPASSSAERDLPGILLVQLGTPSAPTPAAVKRFLGAFLGDPRVVEGNRLVWWLVRNALVLPRRAAPSAAAYRKIWTEAGSPLLVNTRALSRGLAERLGNRARVAFAMPGGEPELGASLDGLCARGCRRIRVLPLFPQYSNTTTGSVYDAVGRWIASRRNPPSIDLLPSFPTSSGYLRALEQNVRAAVGTRTGREHFVFSFHGLPVSYVERGDPYPAECGETAQALARGLGLRDEEWSLVWQSRFGKERWLEPSAAERVPSLVAKHERVVLVTPGFVADCLETLEELGVRLRTSCREVGRGELVLVPALNSSPAWIEAVAQLCTGTGPT